MTITNSPKDSLEITSRKVLVITTLAITDSMLFLLMRKIKITMKNYMYVSNNPNQTSQENVNGKNNGHTPDKKSTRKNCFR